MKPLGKRFLDAINLPKHICEQLFGKEHCKSHRMIVGSVIMFIAIALIHYHSGKFGLSDIAVETLGAALHGLGLTPFIDALSNEA